SPIGPAAASRSTTYRAIPRATCATFEELAWPKVRERPHFCAFLSDVPCAPRQIAALRQRQAAPDPERQRPSKEDGGCRLRRPLFHLQDRQEFSFPPQPNETG